MPTLTYALALAALTACTAAASASPVQDAGKAPAQTSTGTSDPSQPGPKAVINLTRSNIKRPTLTAGPTPDSPTNITLNHEYGYDGGLVADVAEARGSCIAAGGKFANSAGKIRCGQPQKVPGGHWQPLGPVR